MSTKIDINLFLNLRSEQDCLELDPGVINSIVDSFSNNDNKYKKYKPQMKKTQNVFKNPKIKLIKDKISNKVNLILNKLSENNGNNLVSEFISNIRILSIDDYNEFLKTIYYKILSEINFIKLYLNFYTLITATYNKFYGYSNEYFYNLIENKFRLDYENMVDNDYIFLKELSNDDTKRLNNLSLMNELIKLNYFTDNFKSYLDNYIINQDKYLSDIYFWFKNTNLTEQQNSKIKLIISNDIQLRDKILLENLINGTNTNKIIFKKEPINIIINTPINTNAINDVEIENILEEYLFINNSESLEDYIDVNCKDAITKNKFCEFIINKYFSLNIESSNKIMNLFKLLVKKKILFKSNLSRGLLNIYNNKLNADKMKTLLLFLKNLGITRGLENIMKKYSISII
jgi:hypothetical protein